MMNDIKELNKTTEAYLETARDELHKQGVKICKLVDDFEAGKTSIIDPNVLIDIIGVLSDITDTSNNLLDKYVKYTKK